MANYATLKAAIQQVVKTNGNNEITGALLQQSLLAMINSLGANYQFAGVANPTTNPGTPDQNVFYVAFLPGEYSNFGSAVTLKGGDVAVFAYNGTSWAQSVKRGGTFRFTDNEELNYFCPNIYTTNPNAKSFAFVRTGENVVSVATYSDDKSIGSLPPYTTDGIIPEALKAFNFLPVISRLLSVNLYSAIL